VKVHCVVFEFVLCVQGCDSQLLCANCFCHWLIPRSRTLLFTAVTAAYIVFSLNMLGMQSLHCDLSLLVLWFIDSARQCCREH